MSEPHSTVALEPDTTTAAEDSLSRRLRAQLEVDTSQARAQFLLFYLIGSLLAALGAYLSVKGADTPYARFDAFGIPLAIVGVALIAFAIYRYSIRRAQIRGALFRAEADALHSAVESIESPTDLVGLARANRAQMDAYDTIARSQAEGAHRSAFWAMAGGLAVLVGGTAVAVLAPEPAAKYSAALIAAVGTATSGYIARTFIQVRESASRQMAFYFQQPLVQSYLLSAERLASQLPEERRYGQLEAVLATALTLTNNVDSPPDEPRRRRPRRPAPSSDPT